MGSKIPYWNTIVDVMHCKSFSMESSWIPNDFHCCVVSTAASDGKKNLETVIFTGE